MMPVPWKEWEGQVVDASFPLRRYLGGTDHSAVYLTQYDDAEPRNAAIKLVPADGQDALVSSWERAAQLSHPNLLRIFRTGKWQVDGLTLRYAAMEYAEENLGDVLAERPLTPAEVREMLGPLLNVLAYLHGKGMVHGHLKPANIMAVSDELKLSVDGITLAGEPGAAAGPAGPYDPPQTADRGCSPLGDVWSFGMTLVEVLTQRLPKPVGRSGDPVLPETLPAEFVPLAYACLRADPRKRATLDEILRRFQSPGPGAVKAEAAGASAARPSWWLASLVVVPAVALAAILAAPRLLHPPAASSPAQRPAVNSTLAAQPAGAPAPPDAPAGPVAHEVLPEASAQARRSIRGRVKIAVRATVDAEGHVAGARLEQQNNPYFGNLALQAAREWRFEPSAAGEWLLRFEFSATGTTAHSSRVAQ
jgi:TonB family protein